MEGTEQLYSIPGADGPYMAVGGSTVTPVFTAGPPSGVPIVLCHGFPELAYSWRKQIPELAAAGFFVIAPDQRGYGHNSQGYEHIEDFTLAKLCLDIQGILDHFEIDKAVIVGHDWGGFVCWQMPLRYPERVLGVIGLNTPHVPRNPERKPTDGFAKLYGPNNYINRFQPPDVAEAILERDTRRTMRFFMRYNKFTAEQFAQAPPEVRALDFLTSLENGDEKTWAAECILSDQELDVYARTFAQSGFRGPVNWYRNFDRNWHDDAWLGSNVDCPSLMIMAANDVVLTPAAAKHMHNFVPNLEKYLVDNCGHWTQQEQPKEVNQVIIDWMYRHFR